MASLFHHLTLVTIPTFLGFTQLFLLIPFFNAESSASTMTVDWGSKFKPSQRFVLISLVIELWMLTIYSATVLGLAIFLYSKQLIDLTVAAGVLFSLMGVRIRFPSYFLGAYEATGDPFTHIRPGSLSAVQTLPLSRLETPSEDKTRFSMQQPPKATDATMASGYRRGLPSCCSKTSLLRRPCRR